MCTESRNLCYDGQTKQRNEKREASAVPWYWILIILSAIFGPFEAMHALNKARQNREAAEKKREEQKAEKERQDGKA